MNVPPRTGFIHMVYFYLRDDAQPGDAERLIQGCRKHLTNIPGVLHLEAGIPAGTPRAVVDNTYGVGLLVELVDTAAHDVYQDHPDHLKFIEEFKSLWSRVQVYDTLVPGATL
jgi:hypothetical protein